MEKKYISFQLVFFPLYFYLLLIYKVLNLLKRPSYYFSMLTSISHISTIAEPNTVLHSPVNCIRIDILPRYLDQANLKPSAVPETTQIVIIRICMIKKKHKSFNGYQMCFEVLRSAEGIAHVLRSGLVMGYTTSYFH